jgi:hypothetical protein
MRDPRWGSRKIPHSFSSDNHEPLNAGFVPVYRFEDYLVDGAERAKHYNEHALELINKGQKIIAAYERLAIGALEGYISMLSKEGGRPKKDPALPKAKPRAAGRRPMPRPPTSRLGIGGWPPGEGGKRPIIAMAHNTLLITYYLLKTDRQNQDLGAEYFDRVNAEGMKRYLVNRLGCLGHQAILTPALPHNAKGD